MSLLAIPADELFRAVDAVRSGPRLFVWRRAGQLWAIRVLTGGIALLAATLLVGRAGETLVRNTGAATAVTFALGTIAGPLGPTMTEHDSAAALAFGAFLLAWRRPSVVAMAGALAGTAVLFEYQAALVCLLLACYAATTRGPHGLLRFVAGTVPPAVGLAAYNTSAFGSPWHFSYNYVANRYAALQQRGFFGIGKPTGRGFWFALRDHRGLIVLSPVALAASAGLVLLYRRRFRREAVTCIAVVLAFVLLDASYFDPYGGASPGPRFLVIALPFLALGLPDAFRRWPAPTAALALASLALITWDTFICQGIGMLQLEVVPATIWSRLGAPREVGLALVAITVVAAAAAAATSLLNLPRSSSEERP